MILQINYMLFFH